MTRPRREFREPVLMLMLPLEGRPIIYLAACTLGDERRLRRWLRRQHELDGLQALVLELLDSLDGYDTA